MRIECPSCAAAYQVPDHLVAAGRPVRCARCGEGWTPLAADPPPPETLPVPVPPPPPVPIPIGLDTQPEPYGGPLAVLSDPPRRPARSLALWGAWVLSLAVVLVSLVVVLADHDAIAAGWPPMQRLYGWVGLE